MKEENIEEKEEKTKTTKQCVKGIHWGKYKLGEKSFEIQYKDR